MPVSNITHMIRLGLHNGSEHNCIVFLIVLHDVIHSWVDWLTSLKINALVIPTLKLMHMSKCLVLIDTYIGCLYFLFYISFLILYLIIHTCNLHLSYFFLSKRGICIILLACFPILLYFMPNTCTCYCKLSIKYCLN